MVIVETTNAKPYTERTGMAIKEEIIALPTLAERELNDICICDYLRCNYEETVFGFSGSAEYKKDYSDFLFRRLIPSDTVELELEKNGVKVADLDGNLGTVFDGFPEGNDDQKLYYGYLLNWSQVLLLYGAGKYRIKVKLRILGVNDEYYLRDFRLFEYSDLIADGTVKIETRQNGNIVGSEFDFTGLNWYSSLRITGRFGNPEPRYETDQYLDSNLKYSQIKSQMSRRWNLNTGLLNYEVAEKLLYNKLLANEILITDYTIKAEAIWRKISVRVETVEKPFIPNSILQRYRFLFFDSERIFEKRNF